jgi:hypothetical protein
MDIMLVALLSFMAHGSDLATQIREKAFSKETTRELQKEIASMNFDASEVSKLPHFLVAAASQHNAGNFVVSTLIKAYPDTMFPQFAGTFSKLTTPCKSKSYASRFVKAFFESKNSEIQEAILTELWIDNMLQHSLQNFVFIKNVLEFIQSEYWAEHILKIAISANTYREISFFLPSIFRCLKTHTYLRDETLEALRQKGFNDKQFAEAELLAEQFSSEPLKRDDPRRTKVQSVETQEEN